jgi:hypothetical protein
MSSPSTNSEKGRSVEISSSATAMFCLLRSNLGALTCQCAGVARTPRDVRPSCDGDIGDDEEEAEDEDGEYDDEGEADDGEGEAEIATGEEEEGIGSLEDDEDDVGEISSG